MGMARLLKRASGACLVWALAGPSLQAQTPLPEPALVLPELLQPRHWTLPLPADSAGPVFISKASAGEASTEFVLHASTNVVAPADGVLVHVGGTGEGESGFVIRHARGLFSILSSREPLQTTVGTALGRPFMKGQALTYFAPEAGTGRAPNTRLMSWRLVHATEARLLDAPTLDALAAGGDATVAVKQLLQLPQVSTKLVAGVGAIQLETGTRVNPDTIAIRVGPLTIPGDKWRELALIVPAGSHAIELTAGRVFKKTSERSVLVPPGRSLIQFVDLVDGEVGLHNASLYPARLGATLQVAASLGAAPVAVAAPAAAAAVPPPAPATLSVPASLPAVPRLSSNALVIGNSAYTSFGRLANPRNDAMAMARLLESFGIEVDLVLDADRGTLVDALNRYQAKAARKDVNILYYAGHGVQVGGINYIVPIDMRADGITVGYVKLNGVSLTDAMDYLPARTRLVFLDACRDNPASRSLMNSRSISSAGLAPINAATGTLVAYATKDGATAEDGSGANSPFTTALLEHLSSPLDIGLVLRRVRQRVLDLTAGRQEPWEYGSLTGDQLVLSRMSR